MRVVPVPEQIRRAEWVKQTLVFAAPDGDLTNEVIPPAEGVFFHAHPTRADEGTVWPAVGVILLLEDADIEAIKAGARHLLMGWPGTTMPVFMVPEVIRVSEREETE